MKLRLSLTAVYVKVKVNVHSIMQPVNVQHGLSVKSATGQQMHGSVSWALSQVTDLLAGRQTTPTVL